jgi:hypothetical protein
MNGKEKEKERPAQRRDDTYVFEFSDFALALALVVVGLQFDVCEREFDPSLYISYSYCA